MLDTGVLEELTDGEDDWLDLLLEDREDLDEPVLWVLERDDWLLEIVFEELIEEDFAGVEVEDDFAAVEED